MTGKLEDMTEEQLELKMKQILDDYAPILNVTPNEKLPTPSAKKETQKKEKANTSESSSTKQNKPEPVLTESSQSK